MNLQTFLTFFLVLATLLAFGLAGIALQKGYQSIEIEISSQGGLRLRLGNDQPEAKDPSQNRALESKQESEKVAPPDPGQLPEPKPLSQ